nr:uncharacterized protein LOC121501841 [Drosophila kikkawai]
MNRTLGSTTRESSQSQSHSQRQSQNRQEPEPEPEQELKQKAKPRAPLLSGPIQIRPRLVRSVSFRFVRETYYKTLPSLHQATVHIIVSLTKGKELQCKERKPES